MYMYTIFVLYILNYNILCPSVAEFNGLILTAAIFILFAKVCLSQCMYEWMDVVYISRNQTMVALCE